ncbi:hypothetical protein BKA70DRAFT_1571566 [Coprinopsis sp. MPI-PUGE-AT-0042]|nr:hypothetical protein BKA70DRAFT_1571566 [Coprinopsis sp. MPI-PUGE-AT-0042]
MFKRLKKPRTSTEPLDELSGSEKPFAVSPAWSSISENEVRVRAGRIRRRLGSKFHERHEGQLLAPTNALQLSSTDTDNVPSYAPSSAASYVAAAQPLVMPVSRRSFPWLKTSKDESKTYVIGIQKLSGKSATVSVTAMASIMDIECYLWEEQHIHPDQQRLTLNGKRVEHGRRVGELGLKNKATLQLTRALPGAYALVASSWEGHIPGYECDLPYLSIEKGTILVAHKLAHPDWIFCSDSQGGKGLVPLSHVTVVEIFDRTLYEELKHTHPDRFTLPDVSQPPDATRNLAATSVVHPSQSLWRRRIAWLKKLPLAQPATDSLAKTTPLKQRRYLYPWDKSLRTKYHQMARDRMGSETGGADGTLAPPPLRLETTMTSDSKSPPVDPGSTLVLRHDMGVIGKASVVLEVSSCQLTSKDDIPMVHAFVRCTPSATERVTFVAVNFTLVDSNKVLDLWPRDASGPVSKVGMTVRDSKVAKAKLVAEVATDAVKIGGEMEQERGKETESSFIMQTQITVSGLTTGEGARWVLMEDSVQKRGLPIETPLRMRVRYKPREVRYEYAITIARDGSAIDHQYTGSTTLLFP